jgi:hypothetical protein
LIQRWTACNRWAQNSEHCTSRRQAAHTDKTKRTLERLDRRLRAVAS